MVDIIKLITDFIYHVRKLIEISICLPPGKHICIVVKNVTLLSTLKILAIPEKIENEVLEGLFHYLSLHPLVVSLAKATQIGSNHDRFRDFSMENLGSKFKTKGYGPIPIGPSSFQEPSTE